VTTTQPDLAEDQIGFQTERQVVQERLADVHGLQAPPFSPQSFGECNANIGQIRVLAKDGTEFVDGPLIQAIARTKPPQSPSGQLEAGFFHAIALCIQPQKLLPDLGVAWSQLESALHLPNGFRESALLIVDDTQAHPGDQILRICAQCPLEEFNRLPEHPLFQAGLSQYAVGLDMLGMLTQDVLTVSDRFVEAATLYQIFYFCSIVLQLDVWHLSSSPHRNVGLDPGNGQNQASWHRGYRPGVPSIMPLFNRIVNSVYVVLRLPMLRRQPVEG
jgi:hypothetical protein